MTPTTLDLSTGDLRLVFRVEQARLLLEEFSAGGMDWRLPGVQVDLFRLTAGEQPYSAANMDCSGARRLPEDDGVIHAVLEFHAPGLVVEQHIKLYPDSRVLELWPVINNRSDAVLRVEAVDSLALALNGVDGEVLYYSGDWGSEFEPHTARLADGALRIESRSGRSSKGNHPWLALTSAGAGVLSAAVAWSGNWVLRVEPLPEGGRAVSGGLNDWQFWKDLPPGAAMEGAPVVLAFGADLNAVSQQYARVGRRHWYPRNALAATQPIEWNHWWPYEDAEINEAVFLRNVERAAALGCEVCTLDAGWFGPADAGSFWVDYRGDWHIVNAERFPGGIRKLADAVHKRGMQFGIWCEIEGLGSKAALARERPELVALRDGQWLGGVCFGNPQTQDWAYDTLARLIDDYHADWIKLDFNLDFGAGCSRVDHGHGAGDGLYEHVRGYYAMLERLRRDYPAVVLENCSSGGLRIDLGILRRLDMTFLSDPDWPDHDLQIFWGASTMLAPNVLLHWTYSHWRNLNPPPYQTFDPHDPAFTVKQWDYYTRISMLGLYGLSQKLPDLPEWMARRIAEHNDIYKTGVRRFVREADLYRLTNQPLRSGEGERWAGFQYSLPDGNEHLLFVFKLPGGEAQRALRLLDLEPERLYTIEGFEGEAAVQMTGAQLMEQGLPFAFAEPEGSALRRVW